MKKILITTILTVIFLVNCLTTTYATNSSFIDAAQNAIDEYKPNQEIENDALQVYMNQLSNEMIYSNAILNHAQNAADKYWEEAEKEEEKLNNEYGDYLNKYEATLAAETLVEDLKEKLDVYKTSVQIDNKLYLKYSNTEKTNIYKLMTSNAQKIFEKNANYFKKSGANYYDTGRLRTLPIINYTDVLQSFLEVKSASESEATFDIIIKNIVSGDAVETYKNGLKIVKEDYEWLIDSLKFKSTVEEFDYYPEVVEIEKEEPKTEENNKTEDKKEETNKNETTTNVNNNVTNNTVGTEDKVENVNNINNEINISNQATNATVTEKENNNTVIVKNALYVASAVLGFVLIFIVYKVVKYSKNENNDNSLL